MNYSYLNKKKILITGGTGTFGRALIKCLIKISEIEKIVILSRDEFKQHELQQNVHDERLRFFLGDVRDLARLTRAFQDIDIVVHAAALKQVPAIEYNPLEAVKTNVAGTQNVIDASLDNNVEKVLLISSDKAVHPINLYGATKLCAEKLCIAANSYRSATKGTKFSVVRYGNVVGSRGSIIELIQKQRSKGVLSVTDERMTRFWIKIDQVMGIILEAIGIMQGGEIFIPKMNSLKVLDVMKTLAPECRIDKIGIRPGEKLHEILITEHEVPRTKDLGNMYAILPEFINWKMENVYIDKPSFPDDTTYASNNEHFLLSCDKAKDILEA